MATFDSSEVPKTFDFFCYKQYQIMSVLTTYPLSAFSLRIIDGIIWSIRWKAIRHRNLANTLFALCKRPLGVHKLLSGRNETSEFSVDDYFPLMPAYKFELGIEVVCCRLCTLLA